VPPAAPPRLTLAARPLSARAPVAGDSSAEGQAGAPALPAWQYALLLVGLTALGDPFINWNKVWGGLDPAPWIRYLWVGIYALLLPFILANVAGIWRGVLRTPVLATVSVFTMCSVLWSIAPEVSFRRAVGVLYWLVFAFVIADKVGWRLFIKTLAYACAILAAMSYFFIVFYPAHGIMERDVIGAWSGAWTHKNLLGANMTLSFLTALSAAWLFPRQRLFFLGLAGLSLILVWGAMSANARASCAIVVAVLTFVYLIRSGPVVATLSVAMAASATLVLGGVVLLAPEVLFKVIGRDATFTGRTDIWNHLFAAIGERPAFGYGYGAFWDDPLGPAYWIRTGLNWAVPSSHNGWIETALSLGFFGVIGFAIVFVFAIARGVRATFHRDAGVFAPAFLVIFTFQTLFEGYVLEDNNMIYSVFTVVAVKLAMEARGEPERTNQVVGQRL
jgi:exopolysaccharide production protein ExoQ